MTAAQIAVVLTLVTTVAVGALGLRMSRTTGDFLVASRSVTPWVNASAICGEYLSAASFLGIAGLILAFGVDMLWFGVGYTVGYLALLVAVAAPLRRSGAYTLPDFAEIRLRSPLVRKVVAVLVVLIGWLYLVPQLSGAGLTLHTLTGAPTWVGASLVAVVVVLIVLAGGMRSVTLVQALQFWLKLLAIVIPVLVLLGAWHADGAPELLTGDWARPMSGYGGREHPLYSTLSLLVATFLGTMGLPHVLVRFYTNPDGRSARRTTAVVVSLLSLFYLFPPILGALGHHYAPDLVASGESDVVVLLLPERMMPGLGGELLGALVAAGAFAAFLSTASGLAVSVAGVFSQDLLHSSWGNVGRSGAGQSGVSRFRVGTLLALGLPLAAVLAGVRAGLATSVALAFAVAASTICPLLVLGIWWRKLSVQGALAGLIIGGTSAMTAVLATYLFGSPGGWWGALLAQPAAWTVPLAFGAAVLVSLATQHTVPADAGPVLARLHTPEALHPPIASRRTERGVFTVDR